MTPWLSDAWFESAAAEGAAVRGPVSLTGSVVVAVTGGGDGDVSAHAEYVEGRLVRCGVGPTTPADVTLTLTDTDARAVLSGGLDPSVAFMQGRMKVVGAMAPVIDLLALAGTEDARATMARIAGQTTF